MNQDDYWKLLEDDKPYIPSKDLRQNLELIEPISDRLWWAFRKLAECPNRKLLTRQETLKLAVCMFLYHETGKVPVNKLKVKLEAKKFAFNSPQKAQKLFEECTVTCQVFYTYEDLWARVQEVKPGVSESTLRKLYKTQGYNGVPKILRKRKYNLEQIERVLTVIRRIKVRDRQKTA